MLRIFHPDAMELLNITSDLKRVCLELADPAARMARKVAAFARAHIAGTPAFALLTEYSWTAGLGCAMCEFCTCISPGTYAACCKYKGTQ